MATDHEKNVAKINIAHPGALHRALGMPQGAPIPMSKLQEEKKKGGHAAQMAQFAINARKWNHK